MNDPIVWIIIFVFYAPLHFMLPVLFLFIVGNDSETDRKHLIRQALIDAAISMLLAIAIAFTLVQYDYVMFAMVTLMLFMAIPFIRIVQTRKH